MASGDIIHSGIAVNVHISLFCSLITPRQQLNLHPPAFRDRCSLDRLDCRFKNIVINWPSFSLPLFAKSVCPFPEKKHPHRNMLFKIFLLFLLAGTAFCQFFTNGRYGKRSQSAFADDQSTGKSLLPGILLRKSRKRQQTNGFYWRV